MERPVYQRSGGGATYCPLERDARIVITSTLRFAKQVSSQFAQGVARDVPLIDFYHASGYLSAVAEAAFSKASDKGARQPWLHERCHRLKHEPGAAQALLRERQRLPTAGLNTTQHEKLQSAITYFENHDHPMDYAGALKQHGPIGSEVTEAACKTLVKQRLCRSGMRWKEKGAAMVLSLRALMLTPDRWRQFWDKLDRFGFPVAVF